MKRVEQICEISFVSLIELARQIYQLQDFNDLFKNNVEYQNIDDIDSLYHLGSSSGGTRYKILTKIDDKGIVEIEYNYSLITKQCGINIPNVKLLTSKTINIFIIERFNRQKDKVHMISVAAKTHINKNKALEIIDKVNGIYQKNKHLY